MVSLKVYLIIILSITCSFSLFAQIEYEFLNQLNHKKGNDTVYLVESYMTDYYIKPHFFNKENFQSWWSDIKKDTTQDLETFLENFDINQLQLELTANQTDSIIDFKKLKESYVKITHRLINDVIDRQKTTSNEDYRKYLKKSFTSISKPIFNTQKDWAVLIKTSTNPYLNISSGGEFLIYRKTNCDWVLFHSFNLWLN